MDLHRYPQFVQQGFSCFYVFATIPKSTLTHQSDSLVERGTIFQELPQKSLDVKSQSSAVRGCLNRCDVAGFTTLRSVRCADREQAISSKQDSAEVNAAVEGQDCFLPPCPSFHSPSCPSLRSSVCLRV